MGRHSPLEGRNEQALARSVCVTLADGPWRSRRPAPSLDGCGTARARIRGSAVLLMRERWRRWRGASAADVTGRAARADGESGRGQEFPVRNSLRATGVFRLSTASIPLDVPVVKRDLLSLRIFGDDILNLSGSKRAALAEIVCSTAVA
jgi:hypothetical protein